MADTDFLTIIVGGVTDLFQPLTNALQSVQGVGALVAQFGWGFDNTQSASSYTSPFSAVQTELTNLEAFVSSPSADTFLSVITPLVTELNNLQGGLSSAKAYPFSDSTFQTTFPAELVDYLVYEYVQAQLPRLFAVLSVLKVFDAVQVPQDSTRGEHLHRVIDWDGMLAALGNPSGVFASTGPFAWGSSNFDALGFTRALYAGLSALGLPVFAREPESALATTYFGSMAQAQSMYIAEVLVPLYTYMDASGATQELLSVSVGAMPIPPVNTPTGTPDGVVLFLDANGSFQDSFPITDVLTASIGGQFSATGGLRAEIHPGTSQVSTPLLPAGTKLGANLTLTLANADGSPFILIGSDNGDRAQVQSAHLKISATGTIGLGTAAVPPAEFTVELAADQMAVYLDLSQSDGFLQSLLGSTPQSVQGSFGVAWSSLKGFSFNGQAQLSATIPLHFSLAGILDIDSVTVALLFSDGSPTAGQTSITLSVGVTGGVSLGPISATVQNMGVALSLTDSSSARAANEVRLPDVGFGFKPPDGLGLEIDATPVSGGGYVSFGQNQYVGWLELSIDILDLKVFGLLDTQPVSFLLIVQAGFPPIQLGFGFTLNDVGGLVGIDRTMSLDALRAALRAGTLDSTLFLDDPVSQAPQLVAVVNNMFPAKQGHYVFGPMCKIGWGTPTLIEAELGFLIEFPDPVRIAIVGGITCALPDADAALILINLDTLGTIDFGIELLTIDATLYDSRVVVYSLAGDMSFRLSWGDQPTFALSLGGFNPKFQPPPGFPSPMTRMTVSIGDGQNPYLGVTGYMAVTTNSFQFGAQVELFMGAGGFSVHGLLGFDALFIFAPQFSFLVDIYASVDVLQGSNRLFCVDLALTLSGPTPWNAHGTASFSILCFTISFDANVTWGSSAGAAIPPVSDTIAPLTNALSATKSWQSSLPSGADVVASFIASPSDPANPATTILLHPMGLLQVNQTVLPLATQIQKFGNGVPANADYFDVEMIQNGATQALSSLSAEFAAGQFFNLTDDEKLTDPSFSPYPGGAAFGSTAFSEDPSSGVSVLVAYQDFIVDDPFAPAYQPPPPAPSQVQADPLVESFVVGRALGTRTSGRSKYAGTPLKEFIGVASPTYVVTSKSSMAVQPNIVPASGSSKQAATDSLSAYLAAHPDQEGQLQVVPRWEVQTS